MYSVSGLRSCWAERHAVIYLPARGARRKFSTSVYAWDTNKGAPPRQTGGAIAVRSTRCPFHKYTASAYGLASFPRKRESRRRAPWGLDARLRGHDVLLAPDLRNRHLVS